MLERGELTNTCLVWQRYFQAKYLAINDKYPDIYVDRCTTNPERCHARERDWLQNVLESRSDGMKTYNPV